MATLASIDDLATARVAAAYDRWAPVYDLVFGKVFTQGRLDAIVAAEAAAPGGRMLEVGVGTGISLPQYQPHTRLVGIDISAAMLQRACARKHNLGLANVESLIVMDAEAMRFAEDEFDVVVAQYIITSCPDPEAALNEFVRVVKPGGEIIITTYAVKSRRR
jgi:phosphatidylethanolamine/phosphatidyl-N-methylethanolamine N-methyltransferase